MSQHFLILVPRRRPDPQPGHQLLKELQPFGELTPTADWQSLFNYTSISQYTAIFISCSAYADEHRLWLKDLKRLHRHQPIILFCSGDRFKVNIIHEAGNLFGVLRLPQADKTLPVLMERLGKYHEFRRKLVSRQAKALLRPGGFGAFIGNAVPMLEVYRQLTRVAASDYTVLVQGESGSGKELVARTIHQLSARRDQPFISINCAAIPENLLESELFGYEQGAFTGASQSKIGKFEMAHGGTLFLDEIGDMPLELQVKLLRVLEDGIIQRLGSIKEKEIDIRLITATHRDLEERIGQGLFRADLHYRLNVIPITLPPLRSRREDLFLLVIYFLERLLRGEDQPVQAIAWDLLEKLSELTLHGNVRELENLLTRSVFQSEGVTLAADSIQLHIEQQQTMEAPLEVAGSAEIKPLWQVEQQALQTALERLDGNISQAALQLEISRTAIYRKIKKYGLNYPSLNPTGEDSHA